MLDELAAGHVRSIAFVVPAGITWPFPIYELALLTSALLTSEYARERGVEVRLTLVTPAPAPLAIFGDDARAAMADMLAEGGIEVRAGQRPRQTEEHRIMLEPDGGAVQADRIVALPRLVGPRIEGLPHDSAGFLEIDGHARVRAVEDVFAAGDCADFAVKQGGIAAQQADAAAQAIAAAAGADVQPELFRPVLRGKLMAGRTPRFLRSGEELLSGEGRIADGALWWPPAKIAGRYLAPALDMEPEGAVSDAPEAIPVEVLIDPADSGGVAVA